MARFTVILLLAGSLLTRCSPEMNLDQEKQRLLATDQAFAALSVAEGAADAFAFYLAEDAMGLSPGQHPVLGREAFVAGMQGGDPDNLLEWEPQRAEVAKAGDMGWTWGIYTFSYKDGDGNPQKSHGKYLNIWQRQDDGQWKVLVDMGNSSPTPEK